MTTAMIEITSYNEKKQTATTFRPFAWFGWPMDIFYAIRKAIMGMALFAMKGKIVKVTRIYGTYNAKEIIVKAGGLNDIKRQIAVREGGILTTIRTITRYESPEDFKKVSSL